MPEAARLKRRTRTRVLVSAISIVFAAIVKLFLYLCIAAVCSSLVVEYLGTHPMRDPNHPSRTLYPALTTSRVWPHLAVQAFVIAVLFRVAISRFAGEVYGLGARKLRARFMLARDRRHGRSTPTPDQVDESAVREFAMQTFVSRFRRPGELVTNLFGALVDPVGHFGRIKEHVEVQATRYRLTTTLMFQHQDEHECLLPLIALPKGSLIDDLDVEFDGRPGSTLSYIENQGAIALVVDAYFSQLAKSEIVGTRFKDRTVLEEILNIVAAPLARDPGLVIQQLRRAKVGNASESTLQEFLKLIEFLAKHYFILGRVNSSETESRTKVKLTSTFERSLTNHRLLDSFKLVLGLRPREHIFTLPRALETVSYHLSMLTPKGTYVYDNGFENVRVKLTGEGTEGGPAKRKQLVAPYRAFGRSTKSLHVYMRGDHSQVTDTLPTIRLELRERPPGLIELTLPLSSMLCVTAWIVGFHHDQIFAGGPLPGSWPTVLFGIPTLLIGWLFSRIDADTMSRISLTTFASIGWLSLNSLASVLAAAMKSARVIATDSPVKFHFGFTVFHPIWATIMLSCATQLVFVTVFSVNRAVRYAFARNNLTSFYKGRNNYYV